MKTTLLSLAMLAALSAGAQTIGGGDLPPIKPVEKTVYDSAQVKVYYEYAYRPDSTRLKKWIKGQTVLLVGNRYTGFSDFYSLRSDSLNDAYYREKRSPMELVGPMFGVMGNAKYDYPLVINMADNKATVQIDCAITFEYTQQLQPLPWTLAGGDSIIAGVHCKKATCRMGGRDWTAWYSEEYTLPIGPYLFRGLPGLIFAVSDTKNNYVFTLNGLETLYKPEPIYLKVPSDRIVLLRKKAFKAAKNIADDPQSAWEMTGKHIWTEDGSRLPSWSYNPIETE